MHYLPKHISPCHHDVSKSWDSNINVSKDHKHISFLKIQKGIPDSEFVL